MLRVKPLRVQGLRVTQNTQANELTGFRVVAGQAQQLRTLFSESSDVVHSTQASAFPGTSS